MCIRIIPYACGTRRPAGRSPTMHGHKNTIRWVAFGPDGRPHRLGLLRPNGLAVGRCHRPPDRSPPRPHGKPVAGDLQPRRQARRHRLGRSDAAALGRDFRRPDRGIARPQGRGLRRGVRRARLALGVALGRRRVARLEHGAGGAERDPARARELRLRCRLQPGRRPGGLRRLGRHGAALGCDHRAANRLVTT